MIEDIWAGTVARPELPEPVLHEQVGGEWSFVQTHRHLVLATDCWLRRMVKGISRPYHPWGLADHGSPVPAAGASTRMLTPCSARCSICPGPHGRGTRRDRRRDGWGELERNCVAPASPGHPRKDHTVLQCLHVILKEEWQHHRYAVRDLKVLERQDSS